MYGLLAKICAAAAAGTWSVTVEERFVGEPPVRSRQPPADAFAQEVNHAVEQKSRSSENSGVAELKEDGQVSCDTAQNLRFTCSYITPHARAAAGPASASLVFFAFSCSISV